MREFKFRGYDDFNKEWRYGSLNTKESFEGYYYEIIGTNYWGGESRVKVLAESVGQFVEEVDKNGDKIYENDILGLSGINYVVKFHNGAFILFVDNKPLIYNPSWKSYVIIGDIHEDKNLLNG